MVLLFYILQRKKGFRRRVIDACCRGGAHRHWGTELILKTKKKRKGITSSYLSQTC